MLDAQFDPYISPLQRAIDDIRCRGSAPASERRRAAESAVARIDAFLDELEQLHLRGGIRVPNAMVVRLAGFLDSLPREWPTSFPLRTTITYVIDDLFTVQEYALELKRGGGPLALLSDEDLEGAAS